jgi:methylated-DNA-protein-cysteine methyltransferase-like protein
MLESLRRAVWKIPRGKVATYGQVARAAGHPGAARQVAWALHAAKGGLPWHRVVGAGGRILLPGSQGLEQRLRLEQEGVRFAGARIRMAQHQHRFR